MSESPDVRYDVHQVQFTDDGLMVAYLEIPGDIRGAGGQLIQTRTLQLHASHPDYRQDMEALRTHVQRVLANALEDFRESSPYVQESEPEDDDDEMGMGEGR